MYIAERGSPTLEPSEKATCTIPRKSLDIGRVASATLFINTQLQLPPGRARINGHESTVSDSPDINHLLRTNPRTGRLEVEYQHSAHIAGLLEGHMAVQGFYKAESEQPPDRPFVFIDVSGEVYKDMDLLTVQARRRNRRLQHTAVFVYPPALNDNNGPGLEIIAIDDIYAINYTLPDQPPELTDTN